MPERRVALLRGINVGGSGLLKMDRLRDIAKELGWMDVATLGASGNLLYTAGRAKPETDAATLSSAVAADMGRSATVIVRSHADLDAILQAKPFAKAPPGIPPKWWFVGLLSEPCKDALPDVPVGAPLVYAGRLPREVCWTMSTPDRRAIDFPKRIEKTLGLPMTVRNWNVVSELAERLA